LQTAADAQNRQVARIGQLRYGNFGLIAPGPDIACHFVGWLAKEAAVDVAAAG